MKAISVIKEELERSCGEARDALLSEYENDGRKGVQNLVFKYKKEAQALVEERLRLEGMRVFEKKYASSYFSICGVDEAGRGPLAGPVVAGACILPPDAEILFLNDSKKLSAKKRDILFDEIQEKAIAFGVGIVSPERIDEINILQATFEAMQIAVGNLSMVPDLLLVDAVKIPNVTMKQIGIIKGDAKSVSIAAASILAKVTRDRIMIEMDAIYPQYGFRQNKGYGSAAHIQAIREHGACPIHRETFIKNFVGAE
ncbi:MAG: ribonuclease HII [Lachnospiraceae bacterium]|jgi:ribonuclease HII|nr:ribonuclease HII [Lachnospiraceae bacterium]